MPAKLPSIALGGDDLTGATLPGMQPTVAWGQGPGPATPPAGILQDPNTVWLDPGLLMEPGSGFGSAQKQDILGQAMDDAQQFLSPGGGGGGAKPGEGSTLGQMSEFAGRAGDVVKQSLDSQPPRGQAAIAAAGLTPQQIQTIESVLGPASAAELGTGLQGLTGADLSRALAFALESTQGLPLGSLGAAGELGTGAVTSAAELAGLGGSADLGGAAAAEAIAPSTSSTLGTAAGWVGTALPYLAALYSLYNAYDQISSGEGTGRQNTDAIIQALLGIGGAALAPATGGVSAFVAPVIGGFVESQGWTGNQRLQTRGERMGHANQITQALNRALHGSTSSRNLADILRRSVYLDPTHTVQDAFGTHFDPATGAPVSIDWDAGTYSLPDATILHGEDQIPRPAQDYRLQDIGPVGSFLHAMGGADLATQYPDLAPLLAEYAGQSPIGRGVEVGHVGNLAEWLSHSGGTARDATVNPAFGNLMRSFDALAGAPRHAAGLLDALRAQAAERGLQMGAQSAAGRRGDEEELLLMQALGLV